MGCIVENVDRTSKHAMGDSIRKDNRISRGKGTKMGTGKLLTNFWALESAGQRTVNFLREGSRASLL